MDAKVNETVDDKTLLRAYRLEIEQLKAKLAEVEQAMQTVKATEQIDPVENEENQLFMLQVNIIIYYFSLYFFMFFPF